MAEKDWIGLVKEFLIKQSSGIENSIFYAEDIGGVKYEFVLELPDDIPIKTGISGSEIVDVNKTLDDTIVNVQRVFPDGEVIVDYSFNAKGKGGDVQALDKFNKILKEGKGMEGVLLEYYDTFPVETTLPTTLENDITIPNTLEGIDTPTNVVDDIKSTMIGYDNQVKAFKNSDKNVIGELPVEKVSVLFGQNLMERPDSISYDEFIKSYPVDELGPIPFEEGTGDTLTPDDWLRVQNGTGYQLKEGVTPEEFRKNLDNFIEQIDNPYIKEGLLSRYEKYDKFAEGIVDQTIKSRILGSVNQDVFYDVIAFNDDLYTTKKTEDIAIIFEGYEEPNPIGDAVMGELEDWDLDAEGNRIKPEKPGMDKYDKTLNGYYEYYTDIETNISDTPTNVVDDVAFNKSEAIDNVNNLVDELPLEETFKNQVKKNTARIGKNVATPGGVMDFIDVWELGVLALAVAAISTNEVDEIPTIIYNQGVKMYNSMLSSVGIPGQVQEKPYNINFEKAIKTFNIAEMFMPTAYVEKAAVKEFKKGQEAGVNISVGLGAGAGVPPMQFKGQEPKQDNGDINNIMVNLIKNISNAQKSYPITSSEMSNFNRNPIQVVAQDTADKLEKVEYDSKEKQKINDIYAKLYKNLSNAGARVQ